MKCLHNNVHFYTWKMKNTLSVFNLKQQKNIQIKIKKNQFKQIQNQNFKFDFQIHSKLYLELFDFALYPTQKLLYIWGLLYCALYRTHERLFVFVHEHSFFHALKFRTLTCESAYLFIVLHKHSI